MQFRIQEQTGKVIPGARVTFYFKNDAGDLVNPIVTLVSDSSGNVISNDADLFTYDKFVSIEADGYGQLVQDLNGLPIGGVLTLEKLEKNNWYWWLLLIPAFVIAKKTKLI